MQQEQPSGHSSKVPVALRNEIRAKLASLNIKLALAAEELKKETNPDRIKELRDHLFELKAEAQDAVEKYRWAEKLYISEGAGTAADTPPEGADEAFDGLLVFGDLDLTSPPPAELQSAASGKLVAPVGVAMPGFDDDVEVVFDVDVVESPASQTSSALDAYDAADGVFGQLTYSVELDTPGAAAGPSLSPARGGRIGQALAFAVAASQSAGVPLAAPLAATVLAIEGGADENATIAAALHDVCEGTGGGERQQEVIDEFGPEVAGLLEWCGWMKQIDPWDQRDRAWFNQLQTAPPDAFLVSICYRIANLATIQRAWRALGAEALGDSDKHRERFFWCQRAMLKAYKSKARGPLVDEWQRLVDELESGAAGKAAG
ncbi:MAG: HD domain-containing protein [Acidobacteria bacterium]|nr:HD domain-containing protein [Acidobacteriota bacterium]